MGCGRRPPYTRTASGVSQPDQQYKNPFLQQRSIMPPTFHYRPEPQPTYTYTNVFDNVTYTRCVSYSAEKVYWDDTFTRPGELTPTFVHTTTSVPSDGS